MTEPAWTPRTLEDRLLQRYLADNPGELFLEVNVGGRDETRGPRRIDGILIPGSTPFVHPRNSYQAEEAAERLRGTTVHLLEAKRVLNRNVIGQVEVGARLLDRDYAPAEIINVAVCGYGNADLQWYCDEVGIRTALYPEVIRRSRSAAGSDSGLLDIRQPPDPARHRAFMSGWDAAVDGHLYGSIRRRKTHANMGNLFGWIYGDQPEDFRVATWERYAGELKTRAGGQE